MNEASAPRRPIVYCVVPFELADKLHEVLRRHFSEDPGVEVVVEQRWRARRQPAERRTGTQIPEKERRRIKATTGRRVADRRAAAVAVDGPSVLPRRARPYLSQITFHERIEPPAPQSEDRDTARLVTRFQAGEHDVFSELYLRYFDRIYGYLRVLLKDPHEAEDATQQVFIKVMEALPSYERRSQPFRAWLFVVVRNHVFSHLARHKRLTVSDPSDIDRQRENGELRSPDPADLPTLGWLTDRELLMLVERLPSAQQQVLLLRYMLDLTDVQIAEVLGRSREDVRALNHRAMRFLRERLAALGRTPTTRVRRPLVRCRNQAFVLRTRRFSLIA